MNSTAERMSTAVANHHPEPVRVRGLIREAWSSLRGQRVASSVISLLIAAMCVTVILTAGHAQASTRQVLDRVESSGSRLLTITSQSGDALASSAEVDLLAQADDIEHVAGLRVARDVTNGVIGPGGIRVAAWPVIGQVSALAVLVDGRWPRQGEAIASADALAQFGMDAPAGWVGDNHGAVYPVVGTYRPLSGFDDLDGVLISDNTATATALRVMISNVGSVSIVQALTLSVLHPPDPQLLQITSPTSLAELQQAVGSDLTSYSRTLTIATVGSGTLLVLIVVLSQVLLQRKDIGRRRALGAARWVVVWLIITQTAIPAIAGALLGVIAGSIASAQTSTLPSSQLIGAAALLAIQAAVLAAVVPSLLAAFRDPVRVLRTP